MANRKVIYYIQYALRLSVKSPVCVSGGVGDVTDCDVQRDFDGTPFIPGTSLAGALRGYLEECMEEADADAIDKVFGDSRAAQGAMSSVKVSDLRFVEGDKGAKIITRDGIKLEQKLSVKGAKFDMEAIDTGAECECFLLLTIREASEKLDQEEKKELEDIVEQALAGLVWGEIRLGANKNRGFGELGVLKAKKKVFSRENIKEWLEFDREGFLETDGNELVLEAPQESRYLTIRVPLRQKGGISIRSYSVVQGEPDYAHITSNGCPVIPGSSWNGAIRSRVGELLTQLKIDSAKSYLDEWFGYVKEEKGKKKEIRKRVAKQSNIVISESVIEGGVDLSMTRTKINRYDASAVSGALYSERSHFDGKLVLEIKVRKNYYNQKDERQTGEWKKDEIHLYKPIVGMLLIAIRDIQNGFLAVGGQTAVGRGIFEEDGPIELCGTKKDERYFISAIGALCAKEKSR